MCNIPPVPCRQLWTQTKSTLILGRSVLLHVHHRILHSVRSTSQRRERAACWILRFGLYLVSLPLHRKSPSKICFGFGIPSRPQTNLPLSCSSLFAMFFQFGWGPCCWILVSEIPTNRLRGLNVSIAAATQWLFNFVVSRAVPNMLVGRTI